MPHSWRTIYMWNEFISFEAVRPFDGLRTTQAQHTAWVERGDRLIPLHLSSHSGAGVLKPTLVCAK